MLCRAALLGLGGLRGRQGGGEARAHLRTDSRCGIHTELRQRGFNGCTVYDCFGAGQQVSQVTFGGRGLADGDAGAGPADVRRLSGRTATPRAALVPDRGADPARRPPVHADLRRLLGETEALTRQTPEELGELDVAAHRQQVNVLLLRTSELVRAGTRGRKKDRRGADLMGARLKGADLRGANLRGAYLIAADLTGADLRGADLIGADLRDADLTDADLTGAFFLTQPQLNSAAGQREYEAAGVGHPPRALDRAALRTTGRRLQYL